MGTKGEKMTDGSTIAAESLQDRLGGLGDIRIKKMFGGYGIFEEETMFSLIDKNGNIYLKVDDSNLPMYEKSGAAKHGRMPYYRVPADVLADDTILMDWAQISIRVAKESK